MASGNTTKSLWIRPKGKVHESLFGIIQELAEKHGSALFEPHVTLIGGLRMKTDIILDQLRDITSTTKPFKIQLGKIGYKDNLYQSFFAHVVNDEILPLRKRCEETFESTIKEPYMPHLSLMYHELPKKHKAALAEALGGSVNEAFVAGRIHLVSTSGEPETWKEIESLPLKG